MEGGRQVRRDPSIQLMYSNEELSFSRIGGSYLFVKNLPFL